MFSKKFGLVALALALVAEVCAAGGPSLLTLCVHEDGTLRYEPTFALCCKLNDQGQGECCSHLESGADEHQGFTPETTCQDYEVRFTQVFVPSSSVRQELLDGSATGDLLPAEFIVPALPPRNPPDLTRDCGPPRERILRDLSTVVLRI